MKTKLVAAMVLICSSALAVEPNPLGLQLWSLRKQLQANVSTGMDLVRSLGFTVVESAGTYDLTPKEFRAQADAHGLKIVCGHFPYERLQKDLDGVIADAKTLGVSNVIVAWVPHTGDFTVEDAHVAAQNFNKFGAALKAEGLGFGFHTHGYEFKPLADGTSAYDVLLKETDPSLVFVEMDVFWVVNAGQDPVKLLQKNPNRYKMFHVKDMRKGATQVGYTGGAPVEDNVAVGQGRMDWPAILSEGKKDGAVISFIEDETSDPVKNIPLSLAYLETLGLKP
ncbi:MAG: sugar phosphate isomerase/epimerase [Opitutaceae bacterium]|jgi:sugar phosphate isomerase/epimerase